MRLANLQIFSERNCVDDRPKLLVIIDSEKYIVANCFQHQLFEVFE